MSRLGDDLATWRVSPLRITTGERLRGCAARGLRHTESSAPRCGPCGSASLTLNVMRRAVDGEVSRRDASGDELTKEPCYSTW